MKNYILVEGGDFCRYYAPNKFFGDVLAIEKSTGEGIDYDLYGKYGITQRNEKKDFLYYSI